MEEEYNYSMYTAVCTILICPTRKALIINQINNRSLKETSGHPPTRCLRRPLNFYYNKDSCSIIYSRQMINHYQQHPPHEKYVHVSNFIEDLYALYQRSCKGELATQDDTMLCSAITSFLTKVYPSQLFNDGQASTMQYAFILPSQKYTDKNFIKTILRPLLQTIPWLTSNDLASKTAFYSKTDIYAYQLNGITQHGFCLEREKKYLFCILQKTDNHRRLMLTVRFIRAVYDPDLISASGRSMTALGENIVLSSKMISPPLLLEVPIDPTLAKMDKLAVFLYNKVLAGEEEDSNRTQLEEYNAVRKHRNLIDYLVSLFASNEFWDACPENFIIGAFNNSAWSNILSENMKSRLSRITYDDIMQLFDDVNVPSVELEVGHYIQSYGDEELFQSIVMMEEEDDQLAYMFLDDDYCRRFCLLRVKKAIVDFLKKQKRCKSTQEASICPDDMTEGCAYKISKLVQLSNKLGRPVVMKPASETKKGSRKSPAIQKEKLALINGIQPYGYYLEASISCSYEIKMSLNQVIETTAEDGRLQKSTISILDSSYQAPDMYDFIFDAVWNIIDGHCADLQYKSVPEDAPTTIDIYKSFKSKLIDAIKNCIENDQRVSHDLDAVVYQNYEIPQCTCSIVISHRFLMNVGILPYLKDIGNALVSSLHTTALFGNYKIACLLVTGKFLFNSLQQYNTTYGEFIWIHLEAAIYSALRTKQLKTHLVMEKSVVLEDEANDYKPLKLERYRQVFSKHYFLRISSRQKENIRVYLDAENYWTEVSVIKVEDYAYLRIPIIPVSENDSCQPVCKEKFYIVINPKDADRAFCHIGLYAASTDQLGNPDDVLFSDTNIALWIYLDSLGVAEHRCTFPLEVDITACSYLSASNMKMRLGVGLEWSDPLMYQRVAYSERLTLEEINFE